MPEKTIPTINMPATRPPDNASTFTLRTPAGAVSVFPVLTNVKADLSCEAVIPSAARAAGDDASASVRIPLEMPLAIADSTRAARTAADAPSGADNKVLFATAEELAPMAMSRPPAAARTRFPELTPIS